MQEVQFFKPRGPKCKVLSYLQSVNIQGNYLCKIMKENNFDKGPGNAHNTYFGTDVNFPVCFNTKYSVRWFVDTKVFLSLYFCHSISIVKPTRCTKVSKLFNFGIPLHVSDGLSVHHQEFTTVHTAVKQILLYVQSWTPDDGRKYRPRHVGCHSEIK